MDTNSYVGKQLGNYRVVAKIASGGFASVFKGEHTILTERIVAIKVLQTHLNLEEERDNFLQEAQLLEKLKHRYILPIFDVGLYEGFPYLITEYASSGSLSDYLHRQSTPVLPLQDALTILSQIGQALHYAHQHNIVHRDLKPDNILFNVKGEALLADFGIATMLNAARTQTAKLIGTPYYMAPEQFDGLASTKSDQYALGVIAYELLTGQKPFSLPPEAGNKWLALEVQHKTKDPAPPTQLNTSLPIHVEQAILKAMAKEREKRYADISILVRALRKGVEELADPSPTLALSSTGTSSRDKKSKEYWLYLGDTFYQNHKDYNEALRAYEQAIEIDPYYAESHNSKGKILYELKRYPEALECIKQVIRLEINNAPAYMSKGHILYQLGQYEEALKAYEQAIHLNPRNIEAHSMSGEALYHLGRYDEAIAAYNQAIQLAPTTAAFYFERANVFRTLKRYDEAIAAYNQAIRLAPTTAAFYLEQANLFRTLKRYNEAIAAYDQIIQLAPATAPDYFKDYQRNPTGFFMLNRDFLANNSNIIHFISAKLSRNEILYRKQIPLYILRMVSAILSIPLAFLVVVIIFSLVVPDVNPVLPIPSIGVIFGFLLCSITFLVTAKNIKR